MQPISGLISGAAQPPESVAGVKEIPTVRQPEEEPQRQSLKPAMDEYIPEKKQEPAGLYWLGKDEDDNPKICFDAPDSAGKPGESPDAAQPAQHQDAKGPDEESPGGKAERCTCNTDTVDREIEKLKKKQEELERQINSETDIGKIQELEKKLAQIESELSQKDTDTYRRQHAVFS